MTLEAVKVPAVQKQKKEKKPRVKHPKGYVRPDSSTLLPLNEYDLIVVAFSGGKDSLACLLRIIAECDRLGIPREKIEAWHQSVDGASDAEKIWDWPVTDAYCAAVCRSLCVTYRRQWREGGLSGELLKKDDRTKAIAFELPDGTVGTAGGKTGEIGTRGRHPAQSADLNARYCSPVVKIDVCSSAICNDPRLKDAKVLLVTGERRQESTNRATYATVERRKGTTKRRRVDQYRVILEWSEKQVWEEVRASRIRPHPAYRLGFGRCSCLTCLDGDTEVVTRRGIKPIRSLTGGDHDLLVPHAGKPGVVNGIGKFQSVAVRSFGVQRLFEVRLQRHRQKKTVYATAGHSWLVSGDKLKTCRKTTAELNSGDRLRTIKSHATKDVSEVPFAVAQGFVYGDGTKGTDERPATLTVVNYDKDKVMFKYFAAHHIQDRTVNTTGYGPRDEKFIYGLPRLWKSAPDMMESRPFLLSWLAGYFAADGCVSEDGQAKITSSRREAMDVVRGVAAVCGIGYGPVTHVERLGKGKVKAKQYAVTLTLKNLPSWFFKIEEHQSRAEAARKKTLKAQHAWKVCSVNPTERVEEVFCATVPGSHAFALSDELLTGNCIFNGPDEWATARVLAPRQVGWHADVERSSGHTIRRGLTVIEQADRGTPFAGAFDAALAALGMGTEYPDELVRVPDGEEWTLPAGAFRACGGPT